jgi:hypothetical protein
MQQIQRFKILLSKESREPLDLTSRPRLNEAVFGVSTMSKIQSRAFKNKELHDSAADFFRKTNGEIRNLVTLIV